jgi:peptidoglycan-N-acetylglucosamine deacetylase
MTDPRPGPAAADLPTGAASGPRLTVALTFDHDAISAEVRRGEGPMAISRGEFGVRVGLPRILELLAREGIPATFFVPGHTLATFPESVASIIAAGHEVGCHGWAHEDLTALTAAEERDVLTRSRDALAAAAGRPPLGFRAPYWGVTAHTLEFVEHLGFRYDSSLMADDVRLYRVRHGDVHDVARSTLGRPGRLVEVPVAWALDDWPHFEPSAGAVGPLAAPARVLEIWSEEIRYAHAHAPGGVVTLTMHPECIGRGSRMAMLERLIAGARTLEGIAFEPLGEVVARWAAANP